MTEQADTTLRGREILLCVTGGIACYKVADLAGKLVSAGAGVNVAMSDAAARFVAPLTFQTLTRRRVYTSLWQSTEQFESAHISISELAEAMVVAPATADVIAKLANGLADDLVSTLLLARPQNCPLLIAPAMNTRMWESPATQTNVERLQNWGAQLVGPAEGRLACGTTGPGRMAEPEEILTAVTKLLGG